MARSLLIVLALGLALLRADASAADHRLLVEISPDGPPQTTPFDPTLQIGSPDIPVDDPRVAKASPGCVAAEQVHLTYWTSTSVLVSWVTCDAKDGFDVTAAADTTGANIAVTYGPVGKKGRTAKGVVTSYFNNYASVSKPSYASGVIHHVLLKSLKPGTSYTYTIAGDGANAVTRTFTFTMPKGSFPFRLGVVADPGQTSNTSVVLQHLIESKPTMVTLVGDFCYADAWLNLTTRISGPLNGKYTLQSKWDTWGRLFEPLLSTVPFLSANGNHEVERLSDDSRSNSYNHRYPNPFGKPSALAKGPTAFPVVTASSPYSNLYYSSDMPGIFKQIFLTSYAPNQVFNSTTDAQYMWLEAELKAVNRKKTPWVIVNIHAPWYNTYAGHYKENECMRQGYEPLMLKYGVDIMLFGHVHAYERTKPVYNYQVDKCGPVHITIGDGGNVEGMYKNFIDTVSPKPAYCANASIGTQFPPYQPQACLSYQNNEYCFSSQPAWSAYREPSFGHGTLDFINATVAKWRWIKNQWPSTQVADSVTIIRDPKRVGC